MPAEEEQVKDQHGEAKAVMLGGAQLPGEAAAAQLRWGELRRAHLAEKGVAAIGELEAVAVDECHARVVCHKEVAVVHVAHHLARGVAPRPGPGGVLVKLVKPGQDRRADLPAVGPDTIRGAAAAGLRGVAFEAGGTLLHDRPACVAAAEAMGLFLLGVEPGRPEEG